MNPVTIWWPNEKIFLEIWKVIFHQNTELFKYLSYWFIIQKQKNSCRKRVKLMSGISSVKLAELWMKWRKFLAKFCIKKRVIFQDAAPLTTKIIWGPERQILSKFFLHELHKQKYIYVHIVTCFANNELLERGIINKIFQQFQEEREIFFHFNLEAHVHDIQKQH